MKFGQSYFMAAMFALSCNSEKHGTTERVRLITLDPGHFHAALVQKSMYDDVDSSVFVYAPKGPDVQLHLDKINTYNTDPKKPTHWKENVYLGDDFLQKMIADKKGNVVVIAGNNKNKTTYIKQSIDAGFNVLGDKPMAIDASNFELLKSAFNAAGQNNVLLYDIMTERYEITNRLQREIAMLPEIFGSLQKGTADKPAIQMESVHYFYKYVSGNVLTRPSWFMDVSQQGEGIADVATHLVDLVQWGFFPEKIIDYKKDIQLNTARRWSTDLSLNEFSAITKQAVFPDYLRKDMHDSIVKVFANGEISYQLFGTYIRLTAKWDYKAHEGSGDTHNAIVRGTKANLVIRQGAEQLYKPVLIIEPINEDADYENTLMRELKRIQADYSGVEFKKVEKGWEVVIPEKYKEGHEAHFAMVTEKFLNYLKEGKMPAWEVPNMLAKYYTTTQALELAKKTSQNTANNH